MFCKIPKRLVDATNTTGRKYMDVCWIKSIIKFYIIETAYRWLAGILMLPLRKQESIWTWPCIPDRLVPAWLERVNTDKCRHDGFRIEGRMTLVNRPEICQTAIRFPLIQQVIIQVLPFRIVLFDQFYFPLSLPHFESLLSYDCRLNFIVCS